MKKFILSIASIFALTTVFAQGAMTVNPADFTSNPARFNGKTISVSTLKINMASTSASPALSSVSGPVAPMSVGPVAPVAPGPVGAGAPVIKCNAPRSFVAVDVDFPNDPNYNACFFMSEAMYKSLPKGQPSVNAMITFKGDNRMGYTITMYKLM